MGGEAALHFLDRILWVCVLHLRAMTNHYIRKNDLKRSFGISITITDSYIILRHSIYLTLHRKKTPNNKCDWL